MEETKRFIKQLVEKSFFWTKIINPGDIADLDAKFAPERALLSKIKKTIFNADGSIKDNAVSKIATLTGKGKEMALERMEKIIPGIREDLNILKAIEDIEYAKGQKVGTYMRTGLGVGTGAVAGGPIGAIVGAVITSPQVGVSLLRTYGKLKNISKGKIDGMIDKMKSGKKLLDNEAKLMNEAIDNAAKKAGERMKNIRPGLNIQEVGGKKVDYGDDLIQEAKKYKSAEEFVSSVSKKAPQGTVVYRGGDKNGSWWTFNKDAAHTYAGFDESKIASQDISGMKFKKVTSADTKPGAYANRFDDALKNATKEGYDGIVDEAGMIVMNPKSKLTDIRNKANNVSEKSSRIAEKLKTLKNDEKYTFSDFTDFASGAYKPAAKEADELRKDVVALMKRLGMKIPKTDQGIANAVSKVLERINFKPRK